MPKYNGTGPAGAGPMTGRKMGPCAGGTAYGYGCRRQRFNLLGGKEEKEALKNEAELLRQDLDTVNKRLSELKDEK